MKIAYAGFDLMYSAFEALAKEHEILRLYTCAVDGKYETNARVIALAESLGAAYTCEKITARDIGELIDEGCELLVSAGYYYRIPVDDRLPMVNIHPSLLPYGRGAWPMPIAILNGLNRSGVTVHKTERGFDTGDILLQKGFGLTKDETLESFMDKVNAILPGMMKELTSGFDRLWREARPQGEGTYQRQPDPEEYTLSPDDDVDGADKVLRAFFGFPCYYNDGERVRELIRCRAYRGGGVGYPLRDGYIR